jgi:hypothetical protein
MSYEDNKVILISTYNNSSTVNNVINLQLPFPINLVEQEVALQSLYLYYSWPNINNTTFTNNTLSYIFNSTTYNLTLPNGFYAVSDINAFIQLQMFTNGNYLLDSNGNPVYYISIVTNPTYYTNTLTCTPIPSSLPTGYTNPHSITLSGQSPQLVINNAAFGSLLGYATGSYPASPSSSVYQTNGTITPQISPVNNVVLGSNLVSNSKFNSFPNTIYTFSANTTYGSQIQITPYQLLFIPVLDGWYTNITLNLTDQSARPLQNIDNNISVSLIIRNRKK